MRNKFYGVILMGLYFATACAGGEEHKTSSYDYFASGCLYEEKGWQLLAILNFQQAMRFGQNYKQALSHAEACASSFQSMTSWPTRDKHAADSIADELELLNEDWNRHDIQAATARYDDAFVNNDGLDKRAVVDQLDKLWKAYPDVQREMDIVGLAIQGDCAVVRWKDKLHGHAAKEEPKIPGKGKLETASQGVMFLTHHGKIWKIDGLNTDAEDVSVSFAKSESMKSQLTSPSEVRQGSTFMATSKQFLPVETVGVCSITSANLEYPQPQPKDSWRPIDAHDNVIQRELSAPPEYKNALLMITTGLTDTAHTHLVGIQFRTKRMNVIPKDSNLSLADVVSHGPSIPNYSPGSR